MELTKTVHSITYNSIGRTNTSLIYYVYELWIEGETQPFYCGKGKGLRIFKHISDALSTGVKRNSTRKQHKIRSAIKNNKHIIHKIVYETSDELEALGYEVTLIDFYGRHDLRCGPLCNLDDGGYGCVGMIISAETKKKITKGSKKKSVARISFIGEVEEIFVSMSEANKSNKKYNVSTISQCCQQYENIGRRTSDKIKRHHAGSIWAYTETLNVILGKDVVIGDIVPIKNSPLRIRVSMKGEILEIYQNTATAERNGNFIPSRISVCCNNYEKTHPENLYRWAKLQDLIFEEVILFLETKDITT